MQFILKRVGKKNARNIQSQRESEQQQKKKPIHYTRVIFIPYLLKD